MGLSLKIWEQLGKLPGKDRCKMRADAVENFDHIQEGTRVYLYNRVESDALSLQVHEEQLRQFAKEKGFEVVGAASDRCNGTSLNRPGWKEVMFAVQAKMIQAVVVTSVSRVARSYAQTMQAIEELSAYNVELICIKERVVLNKKTFENLWAHRG